MSADTLPPDVTHPSDRPPPRADVCPEQSTWLELLGDREDPEALGRRPDLQTHLESCVACQAAVDEVRRYQTLLLRARVPGLTQDQRQAVEDRVRMMAGQWVPPPRVSPKLAWGVALCAAAVLVALVARPFVVRRAEHLEEFSRRLAEATLPATDRPFATGQAGQGVLTGAVEGGVQVADRDGAWRGMHPGERLHPGMRLRTDGAAGRLVVPGRFELRLAPATELEVLAVSKLEEGHGPADGAFRLRGGEVDCTVEKLLPAQRFVVMFAGFRASVVGTRFTVQHTTSSAGVQVQVSEGAVRVDQADDWWKAPSSDTMTTVRAGNRWHYDAGRMALEPIPLPGNQASVPASPAPVAVPTPIAAAPVAGSAPPAPAQPAATESSDPQGSRGAVQAHAGTRPGRDSRLTPPAEGTRTPRNFLIEVPPQEMAPDEGLPNK